MATNRALVFLFASGLGACTSEPLIAFDPPRGDAPGGQRSYPTVQPFGEQPEFERVLCPDVSTAEDALAGAEKRFESGELPGAYACADVAAELAPQAVEAHHLRAATLAALGRLADAHVAFATALALDPDDPETLAAVSDFYINVVTPRSRDQLNLGLEYARRGSQRAATRRRADRQLRARLLLLEAEAMNDLGSADLALPRIAEALELVPEWIEAQHERGVSLLNLVRFEEARLAFEAVLERVPDDAFAHYHLGLIAEHLADPESARRHMARARALAPNEIGPEVAISAADFEAEVNEAIAELEPDERALLEETALELVELPAVEDLTAVKPPFAPTIMGLYRGLPVGVDSAAANEPDPSEARDSLAEVDGAVPPRAIVLFRVNLARQSRSRDELDAQIRKTLRHELGHARGLGEQELRRLGLE
jgi:tetratricopeptide (TPR) repeat protein